MELTLKECVNFRNNCPICGESLRLYTFLGNFQVLANYDNKSIYLNHCTINFNGSINIIKPFDRTPVRFLKCCNKCEPEPIKFMFNFNDFDSIIAKNQYGYFFEVFCQDRVGLCDVYEESLIIEENNVIYGVVNSFENKNYKLYKATVSSIRNKDNMSAKEFDKQIIDLDELSSNKIIEKINLILAYS